MVRRKPKKVHGVGNNDANYRITLYEEGKCVWRCPYYVKWTNMLKRCYNQTALTQDKCYAKVHVCEEWLTFSNFKAWMELQDWKGKHLDKDELGNGLIYSPKTCQFVTQEHNLRIKRNVTKMRESECIT